MSTEELRRLTLHKLGQKYLAQSRLIFRVTDLRLLSSTGRINTKYDALCLDSDRFLRTTADGMACVVESETSTGITPSYIMAILLLEMHKSLTDQNVLDR